VRLLAVYNNKRRADIVLDEVSAVPLGFRYHAQSLQYGIGISYTVFVITTFGIKVTTITPLAPTPTDVSEPPPPAP
jgi:hypothetical protein